MASTRTKRNDAGGKKFETLPLEQHVKKKEETGSKDGFWKRRINNEEMWVRKRGDSFRGFAVREHS